MPDVVVERSLRERIDALVGSRRDRLIVASVAALAAVVAIALSTRGPTARIAPPARTDAAVVVPSPSPTAMVFVDVAGAVRAPGLYAVPAGARVADALAAAGGTTRVADLATLNLAEIVADGTKIVVSKRGGRAASAAGPAAVPSAAASGPGLVPLNTADEAALETIPGIGPVTAAAILAYRDQVGRFDSIDQLLDVDGIGPATLEAIRPYLTL